jgi:hypothetical protein
MNTIATIGGLSDDPRAGDQTNDALYKCGQVLLKRVVRIMRGCGFSESKLREMAVHAINEVEGIPDSKRSFVSARQTMMCCDVVLLWRRDCNYLDSDGAPLPLKINGDRQSFQSLARQGAPTADPAKLLAIMTELGVVRVSGQESVELISDSVVTCSGQDGLAVAAECVLEHMSGFLGSVEFNVFDKPSRAKGRFERACYATVPKELVPVLQQLVSVRGQDFVDVIDEWLARRVDRNSVTAEGVLVGAGAYVFVREEFT